jgi:hypothetical protein
MKLLTAAFCVLFCTSLSANNIRDASGQLIREGSPLKSLEKLWGKPSFKLTTDTVCHRIDVKKVCSKKRAVWQRDGKYWLVQYKGGRIIKIGWTRRERGIGDRL